MPKRNAPKVTFKNYLRIMELHFTLDNIQEAAERFWEEAGSQRIFAFKGALGAGKTTFITALCHAKGVVEEPSSPTFSLINEYLFQGDKRAYHMDLYRIHDEEEAVQAGIEDSLYSEAFCFIEWSEKIPNLLPEETLYVDIAIEKEGRVLEW